MVVDVAALGIRSMDAFWDSLRFLLFGRSSACIFALTETYHNECMRQHGCMTVPEISGYPSLSSYGVNVHNP